MKNTVSLETIVKRIQEENAKFDTMTPAQKRVAIAGDLIERVGIGQMKAKRGNILTVRRAVSKNVEKSVKELLNTCDDVVCDVCAKGGLFMAYIGRVNQKSIFDVNNDSHECNRYNNGVHVKLQEIFPARQLAYIEFAFEGQQFLSADLSGNSIFFTLEEKDKAREFFKANRKSGDRLVAIAENIIKNEGEFIL